MRQVLTCAVAKGVHGAATDLRRCYLSIRIPDKDFVAGAPASSGSLPYSDVASRRRPRWRRCGRPCCIRPRPCAIRESVRKSSGCCARCSAVADTQYTWESRWSPNRKLRRSAPELERLRGNALEPLCRMPASSVTMLTLLSALEANSAYRRELARAMDLCIQSVHN